MQPTATGANRTGAAVSPEGVEAMLDAVQRYSPPGPIDDAPAAALRAEFNAESEAVGSVPPPASLKGVVKTGVGKLMGEHPELLMDKIGERIAFERAGTRLYDALIAKVEAAMADGAALPLGDDDPLVTLQRIRAEELAHFQMLCETMTQLGGDPTAMTPSANVTALASAGIVQVMTEPRTTLAHALNALMTAELTDNAGWELLIQLADRAGEADLVARFQVALDQEATHLIVVRQWLQALLTAAAPSESV